MSKYYTGIALDQISAILVNMGFSNNGLIFTTQNEFVVCNLVDVLGIQEWVFEYTIELDTEEVKFKTCDVYKLYTFRNTIKDLYANAKI